jgi:hypothetical protein
MTDWIEHTTDTCPVDPETVVEVHYRNGLTDTVKGSERRWTDALEITTCLPSPWNITHYRIVTPAKLPEPEMAKPEPDLINLRLECLKLALQETSKIPMAKKIADDLLHYVLNGSVDKA